MLTISLFLSLLFPQSMPTDTVTGSYTNSLIVGYKLHTGMVVNNYWGYDSFPSRTVAFQNRAYVGWQLRGRKCWHQKYNYPEVGVSVLYGGFGNRQQLGKSLGVVGNMTVPIVRTEKQSLRFTIAAGLIYFDRPFDSISNPHNIMVGSKITSFPQFILDYNYSITNNLDFILGISYLHASNAHYQIPNAGLNLGTVDLGAKYYFGKHKEFKNYSPTKDISKFRINIAVGYGIHEFAGTIKPVGTPKYFISSNSIFLSRRVNNINNYFVGFSGKFYEGYNEYIKKNDYYDKNLFLKSSIFTFFIGHEFLFSHFGFYIHGGLNFYTPFLYKYRKSDKFDLETFLELYTSSKMGVKYYLFETNKYSKFNMFVGIYVKANFGNADYPEVTLGFVF